MICFRDRSYCGSKVETHTCGREFTKQDAIDAEKWWGSKDYPVAFGEFCKPELTTVSVDAIEEGFEKIFGKLMSIDEKEKQVKKFEKLEKLDKLFDTAGEAHDESSWKEVALLNVEYDFSSADLVEYVNEREPYIEDNTDWVLRAELFELAVYILGVTRAHEKGEF